MKARCFFSYLAIAFLPGLTRADLPEVVESFVEKHCYECHDDVSAKGELNLLSLSDDFSDSTIRAKWIRIHDRVEKKEMPPPEKSEALDDQEREQMVQVLRSKLDKADRSGIRSEGRGPVRRLTRSEYQDNLRDLLALPYLEIGDRLPKDRTSHGYTKVSRLLDMSRVHLAAYLDAAETALLSAVAPTVEPTPPRKWSFSGTDLFPALTTFGGREAMFFVRNGKMLPLNNAQLKELTPEQRRDRNLHVAIFRSATWPYYGYPRGFKAPSGGTYRVRFAGRSVRQVGDLRIVPAYDPLPISFRSRQPSGPDVSGDVRETGGWMDLHPETREFETTIRLKPGETFEYSLLGLPVPFIRTDGGFFYDYPPMPPEGHRGGVIEWLELEGPVTSAEWPPASHRVLFDDLPLAPPSPESRLPVSVISEHPTEDAIRLFRRFATRAARLELSDSDLEPFLGLIREQLHSGQALGDTLLSAYQAFLCSGHFLYLGEPGKESPEFLAERLSHFLWNSRPDERLKTLARKGDLIQEETLRAEARRLMSDPRFSRFVDGFTDEWLNLRDLRRDIPDNRLYPEYRKDDYLVASMEKETRQYFAHLVADNLPARFIVDSDYTFANDRLARHYDLPRVSGSSMRKVPLPDWNPYGGILTHASVLKQTSNGTTTSPVIRGVWVMEKILGEPPPPPPKSVPAVEPDIRGANTIRDLLAKHTEVQSCASCHARFDPVGFALENFDVMGGWRDRYRGLEKGEKITGYDPAGHPFTYFVGPEIDASGQLLSGESFTDVQSLKQLLSSRPRQLAQNLLHQLTLYATGTPVRFSERTQIEKMLDACETDEYRIGDLILELVSSELFKGEPTNHE